MQTGHEHTWFVLTQKIIEKEFALSGSEQNPDITGRDMKEVLRGRVGSGPPPPVQAFMDHGADFVVERDLAALVRGMNALTDEPLLDLAALEREIVARDREVVNPYAKDMQVVAIHGARRFLADRVTRIASPHRILDPEAGPLVAVKLHILTRKTLGGLQTDLSGRVLQASGRAAARPLRRGRGGRLRRRRDARLPRARGDVPRRLPVLGPHRRAGGSGRAGLSRRGTRSGTPTPQQPPCLALQPPGTVVLPPPGAPHADAGPGPERTLPPSPHPSSRRRTSSAATARATPPSTPSAAYRSTSPPAA